jgi:hypothetical protein
LSGDRSAARQALDVARDNGVDVTFAARAIGGQGQRPRAAAADARLSLSSSSAEARADVAAKATPELLFCSRDDDEAPAASLPPGASHSSTSSTARRSLPSIPMLRLLPKSAQSPGALQAKLFAALESQTSERSAPSRSIALPARQGCEDRDSRSSGACESRRRIC